MEDDIDPKNEEIDIDCEHAGQIMRKLVGSDDSHDLKIIAGLDQQIFSVHRLIVTTACEYFRTLLGPNFKEGHEDEVTLADIDGPTLKAILDFCYTGKIKITEENVMKIVWPASTMGFLHIVQKCKDFWRDNMTASNCMEIFVLADKFGFLQLRRKALTHICVLFEFLPIDDLLCLQFTYFSEVLRCKDIQATEEFIFQRIVAWVEQGKENRSNFVPELLQSIRMEKLSAQFLHDVAEAFTDKHDCFEVVLYEYRRRALYGENDKTVTLHRNMTPTAENLFAVSGQNSTVTIEKFNANSKTWRKFCEINVQSPEYESNLMLVWNEYFMFCIGGRSTGRYTFVRATDANCLNSSHQGEINIAAEGFVPGSTPVLLHNNIYIFGSHRAAILQICECFSLVTMKGNTLQPEPPIRRYNYAVATMDGRIFVAGGRSNGTCQRIVECYDPIDGVWTTKNSMVHSREDFFLFESSGKLYAIGSNTYIEQYDPDENEWTVIGQMNGSDQIKQALKWNNDVYVLMENGTFGKIRIGPTYTFVPLIRSVKADRTLFVN